MENSPSSLDGQNENRGRNKWNSCFNSNQGGAIARCGGQKQKFIHIRPRLSSLIPETPFSLCPQVLALLADESDQRSDTTAIIIADVVDPTKNLPSGI
ncbi:hypothetical protein QQP08_007985 [Theobroma cacao]|nr:hypothetical protein QQP08_007985 [Theobroma cacao]